LHVVPFYAAQIFRPDPNGEASANEVIAFIAGRAVSENQY